MDWLIPWTPAPMWETQNNFLAPSFILALLWPLHPFSLLLKSCLSNKNKNTYYKRNKQTKTNNRAVSHSPYWNANPSSLSFQFLHRDNKDIRKSLWGNVKGLPPQTISDQIKFSSPIPFCHEEARRECLWFKRVMRMEEESSSHKFLMRFCLSQVCSI